MPGSLCRQVISVRGIDKVNKKNLNLTFWQIWTAVSVCRFNVYEWYEVQIHLNYNA